MVDAEEWLKTPLGDSDVALRFSLPASAEILRSREIVARARATKPLTLDQIIPRSNHPHRCANLICARRDGWACAA